METTITDYSEDQIEPTGILNSEKLVRFSADQLNESFEDNFDEILEVTATRSSLVSPNSSKADAPQKLVPAADVPALSPPALPTSKLARKQQHQLKEYQRLLYAQEQQIRAQQKQLDRLSEVVNPADRPAPRPILPAWNFRQTWQHFRQYVHSLQGSSTYQPRFSMQQIMLSYLGSFLGIAALAYISASTSYPLIAAPFGAAAVLVFAVPNSPLAQPRNLIVGNLIGGLSSVVMFSLFGSEPWVMALAVATAIKLMQLTKTLHPPGGAVALVGVMSHAKWEFLFTPVLTGSIVLLICTVLFNNLMPGRSYPEHWL